MKEAASKRKQLMSIDCCEELLDFPDTLGDTSIAIVSQELECTACYNMCLCAKRIPYAGITDNRGFQTTEI